MNQEEAFLRVCGDLWHKGNKDNLGKEDPVSELLATLDPNYKPKFIVELGCSTGWRLTRFREKYDCRTLGVDPSKDAIAAGDWKNDLHVGTALDLPNYVKQGEADLIIYGYCMAFVDPDRYFQVLAQCDRALCDGGVVIIHDGYMARPIRSHYVNLEFKEAGSEQVQRQTVWRYVMDFKRLWLAHPHYREVAELISNHSAELVVALRKVREGAFADYIFET